MISKELITRLLGLKFPLLDAYRWTIVLDAIPLSSGKQKAFNRETSGAVVMGILTNHLIRVSNIVGIPRVYIKEFVKIRKAYRREWRRWTATKNNIYKEAFHEETNRLLGAVCESLEGIVQKSIE